MLAFWLAVLPAAATSAQFVPDKPVVIHPAVESTPVQQGSLKGPGRGLGYTVPPAPPRPTAARRSRPHPPPVEPPPAPEISATSAAIEQTSQGERPAIEPEVAFDALGDGLAARALPADTQTATGEPESAARGGIDMSLATAFPSPALNGAWTLKGTSSCRV